MRIVAAATELLSEVGYDGMSMDAVAARAGVSKATIYRRWSGKAPLVLDTVRARELPLGDPPNTGELRGDLLELFGQVASCLDPAALDHLGGVMVAMRLDADLRRAVSDVLMAAWVRGSREIVERAVDRGEIKARSAEAVDLFTRVGPSVIALRFFVDDGPIDQLLMRRLVDEILLPILRCG